MQELKQKLESLFAEIQRCKKALDPGKIQNQIQELTTETQKPNFWDDQKHAQKISQELDHLQKTLETWKNLEKECRDQIELTELINPEKDPKSRDDLAISVEKLEKNLHKASIQLFLNGKYDKNDAILTFHVGAGGVDAQDWAGMLFRMYLRYAEKHDFKAEILEKSDNEEAGIKSATVEIKGPFAYGYLKNEKGVHRLVRLSPFNIKHTRETSFALVEIIPKLEQEHDFEIKKDDLKVEVFRSSGPGGQSVNTTDSAVRITHIPTGLTASCQNERSQLQNKERAMQILKGRLIHLQEQIQAETIDELRGEHVENSWGSQIRSYVLHPYKMVKDHRTNHEQSNVDDVLDGELDEFIEKKLEKTTS